MRIPAWILLSIMFLIPATGYGQSVNIDLGAAGQAGATARIVQLTALITVLSLAPSLLVMTTAFTRIVIVLSLLRNALSTQGTPPNVVLIGLALFLSFFVMEPAMNQAWVNGIQPMTEGRISETDGLRLATEPFLAFMTDNVRDDDLRFFIDLGHLQPTQDAESVPWRALVPAFVVGELRRRSRWASCFFCPSLLSTSSLRACS